MKLIIRTLVSALLLCTMITFSQEKDDFNRLKNNSIEKSGDTQTAMLKAATFSFVSALIANLCIDDLKQANGTGAVITTTGNLAFYLTSQEKQNPVAQILGSICGYTLGTLIGQKIKQPKTDDGFGL